MVGYGSGDQIPRVKLMPWEDVAALFPPPREEPAGLAAWKNRAARRVRTLLAEVLGPVTLTRDEDGRWAEMEEPAERLLVAGSAPLEVVAGARNVNRRRLRIG